MTTPFLGTLGMAKCGPLAAGQLGDCNPCPRSFRNFLNLMVLKWGYAYPLRYAKVLQEVHEFFKCLQMKF